MTWDVPIGSDNSNKQPAMKEIHNYISGQRFEAGSHTVKYTIQDVNGNIGESCVFSITVQSMYIWYSIILCCLQTIITKSFKTNAVFIGY